MHLIFVKEYFDLSNDSFNYDELVKSQKSSHSREGGSP